LQVREWVINNGNSFVEDLGNSGFLYGTEYDIFELTASWLFDTRNRALFANRGSRHIVNLRASVPGSDVESYVVSWEGLKLLPLWGNWGLAFRGEVAFTDALGETTDPPPASSFFAGGPSSVRSYRESSLGPRDSNGRPYGGNLLVVGQAELTLPLPEKFASQTRASLFFDIGNVFFTGNTKFFDLNGNQIFYDFDAAELRQSVGVSVEWLAPMGLFRFSYGIPLNEFNSDGFRRGDEIEPAVYVSHHFLERSDPGKIDDIRAGGYRGMTSGIQPEILRRAHPEVGTYTRFRQNHRPESGCGFIGKVLHLEGFQFQFLEGP
jgi:outer membrane protein insertion porin family